MRITTIHSKTLDALGADDKAVLLSAVLQIGANTLVDDLLPGPSHTMADLLPPFYADDSDDPPLVLRRGA